MSRQRFIYPDLFESEKFGSLSFGARLLFIGMFTTADDYGRGKAAPKSLRKAVFGFDDVSPEQIQAWLAEVSNLPQRARADRPWVALYEVDGAVYYQLPGWSDKQTPRWKAKSLIPNPAVGNWLNPQDLEETPGDPPANPRHTPGGPTAEEKRRGVEEGRGSRGVEEKRRGVIENSSTSTGEPERKGEIDTDSPTQKTNTETQQHYLPSKLRDAVKALAMEQDRGHGESKRRRDEAKRRQLNTHADKKPPEEQAWEVVTLCVGEPDPDNFTANTRIKAAVAAIGGWDFLGMTQNLSELKPRFMEAYRLAQPTQETA